MSAPSPVFTDIPVVDLGRWQDAESAAERDTLARELTSICHEIGFFQLVGHGVPAAFLARYFDSLEQFFELDDDTKASIDKARSPFMRGWERVGAELTNNRVDHREQLDVSTENPPYPAGVEPAYLRLDGPNQWVPNDVLPGFRDVVEEFFTRMGAVAEELMRVLSVGLGLDADHLHRVFGERPLSFAKLIRYPRTPDGGAGVNPHHDAGFLTLLVQHGVGGLQIESPAGGEWIDVPPRDDAFVVNLGEMLQEMTGRYFVATTHRVVATEPRYSSGYFHGPDLRARLDPLPIAPEFAAAVASSERHSHAGFMARRHELLGGRDAMGSEGAGVYGEQLWNYYVRSYPDNVRRHHPDVLVD